MSPYIDSPTVYKQTGPTPGQRSPRLRQDQLMGKPHCSLIRNANRLLSNESTKLTLFVFCFYFALQTIPYQLLNEHESNDILFLETHFFVPCKGDFRDLFYTSGLQESKLNIVAQRRMRVHTKDPCTATCTGLHTSHYSQLALMKSLKCIILYLFGLKSRRNAQIS